MAENQPYTDQEIIDGLKKFDSKVIEHIYLLFNEVSKRYFKDKKDSLVDEKEFDELIMNTLLEFLENLKYSSYSSDEKINDKNDVIYNLLNRLNIKLSDIESDKKFEKVYLIQQELKNFQIKKDIPTEEDYFIEQLASLINRLTEGQRHVLSETIEGKTYSEIAAEMNMTEAAVKIYIFRAKKKLYEMFKSLDKYKSKEGFINE